MSEDKRRGMIVLEFQMPDGRMLTEEARAQLIEGLEKAFNFEIPGVTPELVSMFAQTWIGRTEDGDRAEEILMRGRLEYPVEVSPSAQAAAADKYFGKDGEMSQWRRVALSKWRHFKEIWTGYEIGRGHGNSHVAIDHHAYSLAKMVPYLLGMPEEALGPDAPVAADSRQMSIDLDLTSTGKITPEQYAAISGEHAKWGPHQHEDRMPAYPSDGIEFVQDDEAYIREEDQLMPRRPEEVPLESRKLVGPAHAHRDGPCDDRCYEPQDRG